jgi:hypothetical protein
VKSHHHLCFESQLRSLLELSNDVFVPLSDCCISHEGVEASLKVLVVPHDFGCFVQNAFSLHVVELIVPREEHSLQTSLPRPLSLHVRELSVLTVLEHQSKCSSL